MWSFQGSRFFVRSRFWTTFSLFEKKQSVSAPDSRNFFNNSGCNFVVWASLRFDNLAYDRFGWNDSRPILKLIIYLLLRSNSNGFLFLPDPWIISLAFSLGNWIGFCLSFILLSNWTRSWLLNWQNRSTEIYLCLVVEILLGGDEQ